MCYADPPVTKGGEGRCYLPLTQSQNLHTGADPLPVGIHSSGDPQPQDWQWGSRLGTRHGEEEGQQNTPFRTGRRAACALLAALCENTRVLRPSECTAPRRLYVCSPLSRNLFFSSACFPRLRTAGPPASAEALAGSTRPRRGGPRACSRRSAAGGEMAPAGPRSPRPVAEPGEPGGPTARLSPEDVALGRRRAARCRLEPGPRVPSEESCVLSSPLHPPRLALICLRSPSGHVFHPKNKQLRKAKQTEGREGAPSCSHS